MTPDEQAELLTRYAQAVCLLRRCLEGFGAFIMGRKLARKERDTMRRDIERFLEANNDWSESK